MNIAIKRHAGEFLRWKHKYEVCWEVFEFAMIGAVFFLEFIGEEEHSHSLGLIAHFLAGVFLLLKAFALAACKLGHSVTDTI